MKERGSASHNVGQCGQKVGWTHVFAAKGYPVRFAPRKKLLNFNEKTKAVKLPLQHIKGRRFDASSAAKGGLCVAEEEKEGSVQGLVDL